MVTRIQGIFASLEFLSRKRLEKVGEEGRGGDKFEGRDKILIFMSVTTKVRLQLLLEKELRLAVRWNCVFTLSCNGRTGIPFV